MKSVLIAALGIVAVGLGGVAWASGSGGTAGKPLLIVVEASPLTVRGLNFDKAERVSVTAHGAADRTATRSLAVSTTGGFIVRFPGVTVDDCLGFSVLAIGSDGSRASFRRRPGLCAPGPTDG
jgi:hypothetical protein